MSFQESFSLYAKKCIPWKEYPEKLYQAIEKAPQEAADYALFYLDQALQSPDVAFAEDEEYQEIMCALAIVTGLKDKRAFPLVLRFTEKDMVYNLLGDYVTELYADMIFRTFSGDVDALVRTIAAKDTDEFAAEAILLGLGVMTRKGYLSVADFDDFIAKIFAEKIENDVIMTGVVSSILEAGAGHLAYRIDEVEKLGLLDTFTCGTATECKEDLKEGVYLRSIMEGDLREWMDAFYG